MRGEEAAAEAGSLRSPDLHDLSDDSDYAAAASNHTAMRGDLADKESGETARVDVVYEKERVTIHPTQYGPGRISGKLRLYLQQGSLFLSWEPNEGVDSFSTSSVTVEIEKYRNLYTIKALPLSDVRFIRRHTPTFGSEYIIIVLSSGLAFPPFYFYHGGIRELFATLKHHVFIVRSDDDPNVFLVNDFQDPLQKSLSSLELPGVASVANAMSRQNSLSFTGSVDEARHGNDAKHGVSSSMSEYGSKQKHKSNDPGRDLSIQVLEKFSLVTKFARDTTSSLFRENHSSGARPYGRQKQEHVLDNRASVKYKDQQITPDKASLPSDSIESDHLPLVWGKQRDRPLSVEEWGAFLDPEGRVMDSKALRKKVFYGGVDHVLRKELWKFLLGYHKYDLTYAERDYLAAIKREEYEAIKSQWKDIHPRIKIPAVTGNPVVTGIQKTGRKISNSKYRRLHPQFKFLQTNFSLVFRLPLPAAWRNFIRYRYFDPCIHHSSFYISNHDSAYTMCRVSQPHKLKGSPSLGKEKALLTKM